MVPVSIIGYIIAACILFAAFWILFRNRVDPTSQFISMCLLALVVAIAPGKVVESISIKEQYVSLERELETNKTKASLLSDKIIEYESTITSLNSKVTELTARNSALTQVGLEKVHNLENAIKRQPCTAETVLDWTVDYKSWVGSKSKGVKVPSPQKMPTIEKPGQK
jgi:septal ring factor EnvC (AmiA/AmiB activator)